MDDKLTVTSNKYEARVQQYSVKNKQEIFETGVSKSVTIDSTVK